MSFYFFTLSIFSNNAKVTNRYHVHSQLCRPLSLAWALLLAKTEISFINNILSQGFSLLLPWSWRKIWKLEKIKIQIIVWPSVSAACETAKSFYMLKTINICILWFWRQKKNWWLFFLEPEKLYKVHTTV